MAKLPYFHAGRRLDDSATNRDLNRYAALETASCGWPVFPCVARETPLRKAKSPLTMWKDTASANSAQVAMAWRHFPDAIHGIHLELTPFVVIDLDVKDGGKNGLASWAALLKKHDLTKKPPTVTTPSLGQHLYFRQPQGVTLGNREGKLTGQGINVRGAGGYVIGPGSVMADGKRYVFEGDTRRLLDAEEIPQWLVELILNEPKKGASVVWEAQPVSEARMDAYYSAAFDKELDDLRSVSKGHRNVQLNDTAFNIFQMVHKGAVDKELARGAILEVALSIGLTHQEINATLNSAFRGASAKPKRDSEMMSPAKCASVRGMAGVVKKDVSQSNKKSSVLSGIYKASDLKGLSLPDPQWICPDLIVEGLGLFAGRPKKGKSFFALDLGKAVATGGEFMGKKCDQGDVLYLALEDNQRRIKGRFDRIANEIDYCPSYQFAHAWPSGQDAVIGFHEWAASVPKPRLIMVDTLKKIKARPKGKSGENYADDYEAMELLHKFYLETGISILTLTHTRKSEAEDVYDTVTGTLGTTGAVDNILILEIKRDGVAALHGTGRDMDSFEHAVKFDKELTRWQLVGNVSEVVSSGVQKKILSFMSGIMGAVGPSQVAEATGFNVLTITKELRRLVEKELIEMEGRGRYLLPFSA